MTRTFYAIPAMLCLTAAVAMAQADKPANPPAAPQPGAQQPAPKPSAPPASSTSAANKVTYTGCVKPGTGTDSWVLENAEASAKAGAASGTVGTSGTSKMTLNLDPAASVDLKPHANHKVEVTGSISPAKPGAAASTPAAGAAARQDFSVESVKMVSATCP
jgi:hypothetical protein